MEFAKTWGGKSVLGFFRPIISLDLRDSGFHPTSGVFSSLVFEWMGSITRARDPCYPHAEAFSKAIKLLLIMKGYIPIFGKKFILALLGKFGSIFHLVGGSVTHPARRFYLGGTDSLRGFSEASILSVETVEKIEKGELRLIYAQPGGNTLLNIRSEFRVYIGSGFELGFFIDGGNLWDSLEGFEPFNLRYSAGLGLRYITPVGHLGVDWGFNLRPKAYLNEGIGAFHFSVGLF
jgi:outer membrane protein assembly factor BamA